MIGKTIIQKKRLKNCKRTATMSDGEPLPSLAEENSGSDNISTTFFFDWYSSSPLSHN